MATSDVHERRHQTLRSVVYVTLNLERMSTRAAEASSRHEAARSALRTLWHASRLASLNEATRRKINRLSGDRARA